MTFVIDVADGVTRLARSNTCFLSTGFDGGTRRADAAYNVAVPEGWGDDGPRDLRAYVDDRLVGAGFNPAPDAPALLTGVDQRHARVARLEDVVVLATVGISNPAALPVDVPESLPVAATGSATESAETGRSRNDENDGLDDTDPSEGTPPIGTVNLLLGTTRALSAGALANLVAVAAEAKAATLLATTGFPGTTSDAIVVGSASDGEAAEFSGAATPVGDATRACVRDAVLASLRSRYPRGDVPTAVSDAEHGIVTDRRADVTPVVDVPEMDD